MMMIDDGWLLCNDDDDDENPKVSSLILGGCVQNKKIKEKNVRQSNLR